LALAFRELGQINEAVFINAAEAISFICDICGICIDRQTRRFLCLECPNTGLCQSCHDEHLAAEHALDSPGCRKRLEKLELETRLVGQSLCPLTRFDAQSLGQLLDSHPLFNIWLDQKRREYHEVADTWPKPNTLDPDNFPGWQLITIIKDIVESSTLRDGGPDDGMTALTVQLCNPGLMAGLQEEVKEFSCRGHRYLEVPHLDDVVEGGRSHVTSDNKLNSSFYALLAERYSPSGEIFRKLIAEQEERKEARSTPPDSGLTPEGYKNLLSKLSEVPESHDENPVSAFDKRVQSVERLLECLNASENCFSNLAKWQKPFCADKTLTLRDAMWQVAKAIIACHEDPESLIKVMGWASKLQIR
jgi:hypothetical protein